MPPHESTYMSQLGNSCWEISSGWMILCRRAGGGHGIYSRFFRAIFLRCLARGKFTTGLFQIGQPDTNKPASKETVQRKRRSRNAHVHTSRQGGQGSGGSISLVIRSYSQPFKLAFPRTHAVCTDKGPQNAYYAGLFQYVLSTMLAHASRSL
jgi:hypothetical protein